MPLGEGERSHQRPDFLPGGRSVLFSVRRASLEASQLGVVSLDTGERQLLGDGLSPRYVPTGHIVFARPDGTLWAVPFDGDRLEIRGDPVPVLEHVRVEGGGAVQFAVSGSGSLAYITAAGTGGVDLVWVNRDGSEESVGAESGRLYNSVQVSPDGGRVAVEIVEGTNADVWVHDLEQRTPTRLSFDATRETAPIWTPDGQRLMVTVQALWNVGTDFVLVPFAVISYALGDEAGAHEAIAA